MNPQLQRALLLFQQSRFDLAENELRQALAANPDDGYTHALLALCLNHRERFKDATEEAQQAIHLAPDFPFAHYAMACVLHDRRHYPEARAAIEEAIRLDSADADYFALLAAVHLDERHWPDGLNAAEQGLKLDPEHVQCTNLRAIALVKLGRKAEAGATIDAALARNPDNSVTHANQGWTLLERGDPKKALEHFREALRLDPRNEWAQYGIVEALKARNFIYALMLKYFLWMSKLSPGVQWGIVLGGFFGNRALSSLAESNPSLAPWLIPLRIVYVAFALMTWIAVPLFNLLLRFNRFGRLALSREQMVATNWFGMCLFLALLGLAGCVAFGWESVWMIAAVVFGLLVLPVSGVFKCPEGWPRTVMGTYTAVVAAAGLVALGATILIETRVVSGPGFWEELEKIFFGAFLIGVIGSTWLVNFLVFNRPRR